MPNVNLAAVREQLFLRPKVVTRLCRDFAMSVPASPDELARSLIVAFGQVPTPDSWSIPSSIDRVFRAAVFALGSNCRQWSRFVRVEPQICANLYSYDPRKVAEKIDSERSHEIAILLGGITANADAFSIESWAQLLNRIPTYADHLERLRLHILDVGIDPGLVPAVASCILGFGAPFTSANLPPPPGLETWKVPGMGGVLASEFLRNLHWDTYKPDRHIIRLLSRWFPEAMLDAQGRGSSLVFDLFGHRKRAARDFLAGSLLGIAVTPPGTALAEADNLIWALGAYVERKGRETKVDYTME